MVQKEYCWNNESRQCKKDGQMEEIKTSIGVAENRQKQKKQIEISERWMITSVFILMSSVFLISTILRSWVIGVLGYLIIGSLIFTSNNLAHKHLERKEQKEKSRHHRTT